MTNTLALTVEQRSPKTDWNSSISRARTVASTTTEMPSNGPTYSLRTATMKAVNSKARRRRTSCKVEEPPGLLRQ